MRSKRSSFKEKKDGGSSSGAATANPLPPGFVRGSQIKAAKLTKFMASRKGHCHAKFFVLREPTDSGPGCLEYYDKEVHYEQLQLPRKLFVLDTENVFHVNVGTMASKLVLTLLLGVDQQLSVGFDSEETRNDWYQDIMAVLADQPQFREAWQVSVQNRSKTGGAQPVPAGLFRLCLADTAIWLVPARPDGEDTQIKLEFHTIRQCGRSSNGMLFFLELGRMAACGEGEVWISVDDKEVCERIHQSIIRAISDPSNVRVKQLTNKRRKESIRKSNIADTVSALQPQSRCQTLPTADLRAARNQTQNTSGRPLSAAVLQNSSYVADGAVGGSVDLDETESGIHARSHSWGQAPFNEQGHQVSAEASESADNADDDDDSYFAMAPNNVCRVAPMIKPTSETERPASNPVGSSSSSATPDLILPVPPITSSRNDEYMDMNPSLDQHVPVTTSHDHRPRLAPVQEATSQDGYLAMAPSLRNPFGRQTTGMSARFHGEGQLPPRAYSVGARPGRTTAGVGPVGDRTERSSVETHLTDSGYMEMSPGTRSPSAGFRSRVHSDCTRMTRSQATSTAPHTDASSSASGASSTSSAPRRGKDSLGVSDDLRPRVSSESHSRKKSGFGFLDTRPRSASTGQKSRAKNLMRMAQENRQQQAGTGLSNLDAYMDMSRSNVASDNESFRSRQGTNQSDYFNMSMGSARTSSAEHLSNPASPTQQRRSSGVSPQRHTPSPFRYKISSGASVKDAYAEFTPLSAQASSPQNTDDSYMAMDTPERRNSGSSSRRNSTTWLLRRSATDGRSEPRAGAAKSSSHDDIRTTPGASAGGSDDQSDYMNLPSQTKPKQTKSKPRGTEVHATEIRGTEAGSEAHGTEAHGTEASSTEGDYMNVDSGASGHDSDYMNVHSSSSKAKAKSSGKRSAQSGSKTSSAASVAKSTSNSASKASSKSGPVGALTSAISKVTKSFSRNVRRDSEEDYMSYNPPSATQEKSRGAANRSVDDDYIDFDPPRSQSSLLSDLPPVPPAPTSQPATSNVMDMTSQPATSHVMEMTSQPATSHVIEMTSQLIASTHTMVPASLMVSSAGHISGLLQSVDSQRPSQSQSRQSQAVSQSRQSQAVSQSQNRQSQAVSPMSTVVGTSRESDATSQILSLSIPFEHLTRPGVSTTRQQDSDYMQFDPPRPAVSSRERTSSETGMMRRRSGSASEVTDYIPFDPARPALDVDMRPRSSSAVTRPLRHRPPPPIPVETTESSAASDYVQYQPPGHDTPGLPPPRVPSRLPSSHVPCPPARDPSGHQESDDDYDFEEDIEVLRARMEPVRCGIIVDPAEAVISPQGLPALPSPPVAAAEDPPPVLPPRSRVPSPPPTPVSPSPEQDDDVKELHYVSLELPSSVSPEEMPPLPPVPVPEGSPPVSRSRSASDEASDQSTASNTQYARLDFERMQSHPDSSEKDC